MIKTGRSRSLIIATHNPDKLDEWRPLLAAQAFTLSCAADHGAPEPDETGETFAENALIKAQSMANHWQAHNPGDARPYILADDSGLCLEAWPALLGVRSARFAQTADGTRDFAAANQAILTLLAASGDRRARFVCVLALLQPDGEHQIFEGVLCGAIADTARGQGFGYDPIFVPDGQTRTLAQIRDDGLVDAVTHRTRACAHLLDFLSHTSHAAG